MLRTTTSLPRPLRHFSTTVVWRNSQGRPNGRPSSHSVDGKAIPLTSPSSSEAVASGSSAIPNYPGKEEDSFSLTRSIPLTTPPLPPTSSSPSSTDDNTAPKLAQGDPEVESNPERSESANSTSDTPGNLNIEEVKERIRSWAEQAVVTIRHRADDFTASTKKQFSQLGAHLNKVTGYEEIEALKREVVAQEQRINDTRRAARQAKVLYEEAVIQRSKSQREVNDLLQRKSTWSDSDVSRFTTLVRQDHLKEQEEQRAKSAVNESENAVEKEFSQLMRLILARYHEEQVWSDKIRSASTYGQLAALGLNLLVFLLAIALVEPWKRKRLAQTFERKVEQLSEDYARMLEKTMKNIENKLAGNEAHLVSLAKELAVIESDLSPASLTNLPVQAAVVDAVSEVLETPSVEEVKVKVKVKDKGETRYVRIPGVAEVPVSARTMELAAVGTGTFVLGVLASVLMGGR
ncbi:hypothetical protein D9611_014676 [Ephemerocybe angulata]|uniref:Sensitive to high expression protein 9, mitochondrial n=1 Tax=Ephemerocybe angulata TaxID=980116 RepID=A0A8H5B9A0_9AGAR|nr:hypothetical protein D9611_014676 [Tulosesus angulatus]